jgi:hypothetical protein
VNKSNRIVVRRFLTKAEILSEYGKNLSKEDKQKINDMW